MSVLIDDRTEDGIRVRIEQPPVGPLDIYVNDEKAVITGYRHYRDGGTQVYETDKGNITLPHKMRSADRVPKLDGKDIGPVPEAVLRERAEAEQVFARMLKRESGW